ncbi:MAG: DUF6508 domain-containing protein [Actinomycetaceae bacterium]|nr:DUF6508 domain-containing protein [Actinomycetaceae bacterium]
MFNANVRSLTLGGSWIRSGSAQCTPSGFYDDDDRVWEGLHAALDMVTPDFDDGDHLDGLKEMPVAQTLPKQLQTYVTYVTRGERFCEGFLASVIDSGRLQETLERFLELYGNEHN